MVHHQHQHDTHHAIRISIVIHRRMNIMNHTHRCASHHHHHLTSCQHLITQNEQQNDGLKAQNRLVIGIACTQLSALFAYAISISMTSISVWTAQCHHSSPRGPSATRMSSRGTV